MVDSNNILYTDSLPAGTHWSLTMKRGHTLRLIDDEGGANVGMLFYNPYNLLERINIPDTLKCQHTFKLTKGNCLYSDMGHIFCSIIEDTFGWHDGVCGNTNQAMVASKWGAKSYQEFRNDWRQNGNDSFLVELAKYGLGTKDMAANLNFFSKIAVDNHGNMSYDTSITKAGSAIDLRFEMDTLVVFHTCPHPLNPVDEYPKHPVTYQILKADSVQDDDFCKNSCVENQHGFMNNYLYNLQN
ncbi:urea amidolyase associated protein UAAP1 [Maribacter antarcticus]|uniref:urea amidolyase associated protein UAAP1 n=1 Tax=Maribacter antarcticus TaxID=505250 RepID=UPI00047CE1E6|nr:urea amidolyase associated protein UAAP1 [Maribacter antarcticus]